MKTVFSIMILLSFVEYKLYQETNLIGTYYSVGNIHDKRSIMELKENGVFKYTYGLSACHAEITGTYSIENDKIRFKNDIEYTKKYLKRRRDSIIKLDSLFTGIGIPMYPDLSLTEWKIKTNAIKPISRIDCGCMTEKNKHVKQ